MSKAEVFTTLPDEINAALDSQWSEMKSYEEGAAAGWSWCCCAGAGNFLLQHLAQTAQKSPRRLLTFGNRRSPCGSFCISGTTCYNTKN